MNKLSYDLELLESQDKMNYRIQRNKTISILGIITGVSVFISSIFPIFKEANYMSRHPNYEPPKEKMEELAEKFTNRGYIGLGITGTSVAYLFPGLLVPIARHKKRKRSLDKEFEDN